MRSRSLLPCALLGSSLLAACSDDTATTPNGEAPPVANALTTGEKFSYIKITTPTTTTYSLGVGGVKQMYAKMYFSLGGVLSSTPYATWYSKDPCIAKVTSTSPSWGKVTGVKYGTTPIIVTYGGKADTVKVSVTGSSNLDPNCYTRLWTFNTSDVSFTGTPATSYYVKSGEVIRKLVLFAPKDYTSWYVGKQKYVIGEMWYNLGGKLNGRPYVTFMSTDGTVASIDSKTGYVTAKKVGRTKLIMSLGNMADTIPLYVK